MVLYLRFFINEMKDYLYAFLKKVILISNYLINYLFILFYRFYVNNYKTFFSMKMKKLK